MRDAFREKHKEIHDTCQDAEEIEVSIEKCDMIKLKTKTNQITKICKYKMDTSSDDNLMLIRMFKVLYPITKILDLNLNKTLLKYLLGYYLCLYT